MFDKPQVGKLVTVTSDWSDVVANSIESVRINYGLSTQTGMVVDSNEWDSPDTFNITTGNPNFPVSNIPLSRVVALAYEDGSRASVLKDEKEKEDFETWTVVGSKGDKYIVTRKGDLWSCTCSGYGFRKRCTHIDKKKTEILEARK